MTDSQKAYVLIVEDDSSIAEWIGDYLIENQFDIAIANRGDEAIDLIRSDNPDLVVLDINLPVLNGYEVCQKIRAFYTKPVLMLTARGDESDEVIGLESGANDYMIKPIRPKALLARINLLLGRHLSPAHASSIRDYGELRINGESRTVTLGNIYIELSTHEFDMLWLLTNDAGKVYSRDELIGQLRGIEYDGFNRSVDILISRLRKKLGDDSAKPKKIKTVWGKGYMFSPDAW